MRYDINRYSVDGNLYRVLRRFNSAISRWAAASPRRSTYRVPDRLHLARFRWAAAAHLRLTTRASGGTYNFAGTIATGSGSNGLTFNGGSNCTYNMAGGIVAHGPRRSASVRHIQNRHYLFSPCGPPDTAFAYRQRPHHFGGPSTFTWQAESMDASGMPAECRVKSRLRHEHEQFQNRQVRTVIRSTRLTVQRCSVTLPGTGDLFQRQES